MRNRRTTETGSAAGSNAPARNVLRAKLGVRLLPLQSQRVSFDRRQLEKSLGIRFKFRVIEYDAGSAARNHFRRVCENYAHFVPLLSQLLAQQTPHGGRSSA